MPYERHLGTFRPAQVTTQSSVTQQVQLKPSELQCSHSNILWEDKTYLLCPVPTVLVKHMIISFLNLSHLTCKDVYKANLQPRGSKILFLCGLQRCFIQWMLFFCKICCFYLFKTLLISQASLELLFPWPPQQLRVQTCVIFPALYDLCNVMGSAHLISHPDRTSTCLLLLKFP